MEELYGRGRFVGFMVLCALVGNMVAVGAVALGISHAAAVIGFSGVTMGITAAWGLTFPDREMLFFFFPMRGLTLVYVTLAFEVLEGLSFSNTSAAAHFGGMAAGRGVHPDPGWARAALVASAQAAPLAGDAGGAPRRAPGLRARPPRHPRAEAKRRRTSAP